MVTKNPVTARVARISDPVTAAIAKVARKSGEVKALRSTMAPTLLNEMGYGMDKKNDPFQVSIPHLFGGRLGMTYETEHRKETKQSIGAIKLGGHG